MTNALFIAGRSSDPTKGRWGPVGRLEHGSGGYRFVYTRGARTLRGFKPFPGMLELEAVYESETLFPLFANRLLARTRPEYEAFLTWGGFDPDKPPDPIAMLGVTEGMRQTDSLEVFPCPSLDRDGCYLTKFFLHGVRWMEPAGLKRIDHLEANERLMLSPEPHNPYDPHAVAVVAAATSDGVKIGYVPRYLAHDVGHLYATCDPKAIQLTVERLNRSAPAQQRLLCRMNACWPERFHPCAGDDFQPIVTHLGSMTR
ncbi:MAG: hypothetical protein KAS72_12905 [Phycisphaerales bacterium]|nr:hypothetical protein [Phycisphaerales bacterium]